MLVCGSAADGRLAAQEQDQATQPAAVIDGKVAISHREVEQMVSSIVDEQPISSALRQQMRQQALQQLISQRLILAALAKKELAASDTDIDVYVDQLQARLEKQNVSWDAFLQRLGISNEEYRTSVRWKLSWDSYLRQYLTAENLQRFFDQHRREYDGTELEVAQILLKLPPDAANDQVQATVTQLAELKQQIEAGDLEFAAAAREYSDSTSANRGGSLGRIKRHGAMPEAFGAAAFALKPGEISQPITTNIGVHLIQCQSVIAGSKSLNEVQAEVRLGATRYLFEWLAEQEREHHRVEILMKQD